MQIRSCRKASADPPTLRIAYTPDSDDVFNFYAWERGRVQLDGLGARFDRDPIIALNRAAAMERYDVVAISSVVYPSLADRYWILATGNSIGRGYGPVLASKRYAHVEQLHGKRVAVAGVPTTGAALAAMYCPAAELIEMRYDRIAGAILAGDVDAGVMIHEELLFFPQRGLQRVCDLGKAWCDETGLPLPVGLNVCHRRVGMDTARRIVETCRASLQWAQDHFDEAFAFASRFGRGCSKDHVDMFSNADTLRLAGDVREALVVLFDRAASLGLGPRLDRIEVVDA
jgi:1,4-dihydroxy-6-naphthoate synthase